MQSIEDSKTTTALVRQGGSPKPKRVSFGDSPSGQQSFTGGRNLRQPNMTSGQRGQFTQPFYLVTRILTVIHLGLMVHRTTAIINSVHVYLILNLVNGDQLVHRPLRPNNHVVVLSVD